MLIQPLDRDALRQQFRDAKPFPHMLIPNFLNEEFLQEVIDAYPKFGSAWSHAEKAGRAFKAVNEKYKVQVTDSRQFPPAVKKLNDALASEEFRNDLSYITGIDNLLSDAYLQGGGMHLTGPRGRLDVHVDFNYNEQIEMHRRLNILIYLNPVWERSWGGAVELWDPEVKVCHKSFPPLANHCVVFETSEISYHGVEPVTCPEDVCRRSFAGYYYTEEAPEGWDGKKHSTVFRARPDEFLREAVLLRIEKAQRKLKYPYQWMRRRIDRILSR